jgi:predicted nucleic acid-binding protein
MTPTSSPGTFVADANVLVGLAAHEADKYDAAEAQLAQYFAAGFAGFVPGVAVAEALYALCRKFMGGDLAPTEHATALNNLYVLLAAFEPPPSGDVALAARAEEVRGTHGCSRSADGLCLALAEELALFGPCELVTFDQAFAAQAQALAPTVTVRLLPPTAP